ncbi:MAG: serine hydrolase [Solirubrobacterales bacterium]|nr:serine hydrolase [Solirubrobacterales bacterium]
MSFQAYHGVTAAQHQAYVTQLSGEGYGMISLSVYGEPNDGLYAAVWVDRPMPKWEAVHGIGAAEYQAWFNTWESKGYASLLVSATGSGSNAIFAAVMIQGVSGSWVARHNLSAADFAAQNASAHSSNMIPICVSIYGDPGSPTYAGIWRANPKLVKWLVNSADPAPAYQTTFNTDTQLPGFALNGWRPAYVAVSSDQTYCSVYKDDYVGPWVARHGMSAAAYQTEFNAQKQAGRYPICVQGGGSGNDIVYAAVFASTDQPIARQWAVTGPSVPTHAAIDNAMEKFMKTNGVRAAQVAFGQNGAIDFARAYTWAEPGYRVSQPTDRFLLASCSKMFCEAVIQSLFDSKLLSSTDKAYAKLGFSDPADPRSDEITIQELLDHTAGYDDSISPFFDPTYNMGEIAKILGVSSLTRLDVAHYMYQQPLQHDPGATYAYSNYGYLLLAAVADAVTPQHDYYSYLRSTLLEPEGITEVGIVSTVASLRTPQEAIAEDPGLGMNPLDPASPLQVPSVYGGDGEINEVGVANDGLGASARALAQFAHLHAVWGNGGRAPGSAREGSTPGASTFVWSRTDGVDAAFTLNTRTWPAGTPSDIVPQLQQSIDSLLP